ncbi:MAG: DUF4271 domain-containing protein [Bacteroidaceae bacterium]|nr:DUF4271 domain-containing protein [Bacteroidaceae bacterium]
MNNEKNIWLASDSDVIRQTELYKQGLLLPDRTVPMEQRDYVLGKDDYIVAGMMVMFFFLAFVLYNSKNVLLNRLKDFFTTKRTYVEGNVMESSGEMVNVFLLTSVSTLCFSLLFVEGLIAKSSYISQIGFPYWLYAAGWLVLQVFIYTKSCLYSIVNWTFFSREPSRKWMSGYLLMTSLTAFLFYPLALLNVFAHLSHEIVIWSAILVVILYELLLFYKLIANFKVKKYGYMLIFLYFCSVELLPTLVFGHLAVWYSDNYIVKNILY